MVLLIQYYNTIHISGFKINFSTNHKNLNLYSDYQETLTIKYNFYTCLNLTMVVAMYFLP